MRPVSHWLCRPKGPSYLSRFYIFTVLSAGGGRGGDEGRVSFIIQGSGSCMYDKLKFGLSAFKQ